MLQALLDQQVSHLTSLLSPKLHIDNGSGGFPKFVAQGINDDYLPLWLQQGGVNTYYVGKFSNGHNITNYVETPIKGWTSGK